MRGITRSGVVVAAIVGTGQLAAQERPALDGHRLPLQADTFAVYVVRGRDTVRTGSLIDRLVSDGRLLTRIYTQVDQVLGAQDDSIVSQLTDLRPVSYHSRSDTHIADLRFGVRGVSGWSILPNGDSTSVDVPLPDVVFDGNSYDLIVRSADLHDGFTLTVPAFLVGSNTVGTITGRVTGSETVGRADCWVFEAHFAGMPVTFWIEKRTRALRRQLLQPSVQFGILFSAPAPPKGGQRAS